MHDLDPVIVAGVRTPFCRSHKAYVDLAAFDLGRMAVAGLLARTGLDPALVDGLTYGTVIHDPRTSNIAREVALAAGLPAHVTGTTVSMACISANVAGTVMADWIRGGRVSVGICGGVDTCSDPPIRPSAKLRRLLVRLGHMRKPADILKHINFLRSFTFKDLSLDVPAVAEFSNGKSMGQGCEILAASVGVERAQADAYALRSHSLAVRATEQGYYKDDLVQVQLPPGFHQVVEDGPRADTTLESLAKLRPAFDKTFGVSTAGNSSFLTDGASAVLLASVRACREQGWDMMAVIKDYVYRAGDALTEMLSGPALSIPVLLERAQLRVDDIGVWEIHEAFAAQMVANVELLKRPSYLKERLGLEGVAGEIPLERLNTKGGSLSLGHPFGATGGRLLWTAARRMVEEKARYGIVAGCAAGGHGSAILLENPHFEG